MVFPYIFSEGGVQVFGGGSVSFARSEADITKGTNP